MKPEQATIRSTGHRSPLRVRRSVMLTLAVLAVGATAYAAGAAIAIPHLVDRTIERYNAATPRRNLRVENVQVNPFTLTVTLRETAVREAERQPTLTAPRIAMNFSALTVLERRPVLDELAIEQPRWSLELPASTTATETTRLAARITSALSRFGPLRIDRLSIDGGRIELADRGSAAERQLSLNGIEVSATDLDMAAETAGLYAVSVDDAGGAELALDGQVSLHPLRAHGKIAVTGLDLALVRSWLASALAALAPSGVLDMSGDYMLTAPSGLAALRVASGRAAVRDLRLALAPTLVVQTPRADFRTSAVLAQTDKTVDARGQIELSDADFELVDASSSPPMTFRFSNATGTVARSESGQPDVSIDVDGRLNDGGSASLVALLPAEQNAPSTLQLRMQDVSAPALSRYAARALGRELDAGRLHLALDYRETRERLLGTLHVAAVGLSLAATDGRVETSLAPLPLDLAIALLRDARGEIDLAVPISARTDAGGPVPEIVGRALRERIASIAASPFDVLGRLVERDGASLRSVPFEPGDATLSGPAFETVRALAEALRQRPALSLHMRGGVDPDLDRDALAAQQIELHVLIATAGPSFRTRPEPVDFASPRAQDVLDEFANERLTARQLDALAARFDFNSAEPAEPAERAGYYAALFDALVANEPIEERALRRLARYRAQSVADALGMLGVADERIDLSNGDVAVATEGPRVSVQPTDGN